MRRRRSGPEEEGWRKTWTNESRWTRCWLESVLTEKEKSSEEDTLEGWREEAEAANVDYADMGGWLENDDEDNGHWGPCLICDEPRETRITLYKCFHNACITCLHKHVQIFLPMRADTFIPCPVPGCVKDMNEDVDAVIAEAAELLGIVPAMVNRPLGDGLAMNEDVAMGEDGWPEADGNGDGEVEGEGEEQQGEQEADGDGVEGDDEVPDAGAAIPIGAVATVVPLPAPAPARIPDEVEVVEALKEQIRDNLDVLQLELLHWQKRSGRAPPPHRTFWEDQSWMLEHVRKGQAVRSGMERVLKAAGGDGVDMEDLVEKYALVRARFVRLDCAVQYL